MIAQVILGDRGSGKTHTGARALIALMKGNPGGEWFVAAPTLRMARTACVEGPAGLLEALPGEQIVYWNRATGELRTKDGNVFAGSFEDEAQSLQGRSYRGGWIDDAHLGDWDGLRILLWTEAPIILSGADSGSMESIVVDERPPFTITRLGVPAVTQPGLACPATLVPPPR